MILGQRQKWILALINKAGGCIAPFPGIAFSVKVLFLGKLFTRVVEIANSVFSLAS